jgi:hypothetical protein
MLYAASLIQATGNLYDNKPKQYKVTNINNKVPHYTTPKLLDFFIPLDSALFLTSLCSDICNSYSFLTLTDHKIQTYSYEAVLLVTIIKEQSTNNNFVL